MGGCSFGSARCLHVGRATRRWRCRVTGPVFRIQPVSPGLHACHNTVMVQITFFKFLHANFIYFIERTHGPHVHFYVVVFLVNQLTFFRQ